MFPDDVTELLIDPEQDVMNADDEARDDFSEDDSDWEQSSNSDADEDTFDF